MWLLVTHMGAISLDKGHYRQCGRRHSWSACTSEKIFEPGDRISYKIVCAPSDDSDQPVHSRSLIRVFAGHSVGSQGSKVSSGGQRTEWSDCADGQADLCLRMSHMQSCKKCNGPAHLSWYPTYLKLCKPMTFSPYKIVWLLKPISCWIN